MLSRGCLYTKLGGATIGFTGIYFGGPWKDDLLLVE